MLTRPAVSDAIGLAGIPALWVNDGVVSSVASCVNCGGRGDGGDVVHGRARPPVLAVSDARSRPEDRAWAFVGAIADRSVGSGRRGDAGAGARVRLQRRCHDVADRNRRGLGAWRRRRRPERRKWRKGRHRRQHDDRQRGHHGQRRRQRHGHRRRRKRGRERRRRRRCDRHRRRRQRNRGPRWRGWRRGHDGRARWIRGRRRIVGRQRRTRRQRWQRWQRGQRGIDRHGRRRRTRRSWRRRGEQRRDGHRRWRDAAVQGRGEFALRGAPDAGRHLVLQLDADRIRTVQQRPGRSVRADDLGSHRQRAERHRHRELGHLVREQGLRVRARVQRTGQHRPVEHPGRDGDLAVAVVQQRGDQDRHAGHRREREPRAWPGTPAS